MPKVEIDSSELLDAARCLDDCLIRIYPEEFTEKHREEAAQRFWDGHGTINRISTIADNLRKAAGNETD